MSADHSGREAMPTMRVGAPLARFSSAAEPAVDPMSTEFERRSSLALLEPAENTQFTRTPRGASVSSSHPWWRITRESGL